MCGICGVAGRITLDDKKIFKDMLYVSALRGEHSTGVAAIKADKDKNFEKIRVVKDNVAAYDFIYNESFDKDSILKTVMPDIMMGHCRYATVGNTTKENAHPFETDTLVGNHNGTLYNPIYNSSKEKTDSEMMFEEMSSRGVFKVLDGLSSKSAYAVAVYEKQSEQLILARNPLRPLYIGFNKKRDVMYWASEYEFIEFACGRENQEVEIFYLQPYVMYTIDLKAISSDSVAPWKSKNLKDKSKEHDKYEMAHYNQYYAGWNDWIAEYREQFDQQNNETVIEAKDVSDITDVALRSKQPDDPGTPYGEPDPWDVQCASCKGIIRLEDSVDAQIEFEGGVIYVCEDCTEDVKQELAKEDSAKEEAEKRFG